MGRSLKFRNSFNRPKAVKKVVREKFDIGLDMVECFRWVEYQQEQIAYAKRNGWHDLAEGIGKQLVASKFGRAVAVQTVATNRGTRSPGLSKEPFKTNKDYRSMVYALEEIVLNPDAYKATPLDRLYIPKKDGSKRPLSVPSYTDRCLQALYKLALEPIAEEVADISSFGFRPLRNTVWAAARVHNSVSNPLTKYRYVLEVDIKGCFDNINHEFINQVTPLIPRRILWEWLKCGYIERGQYDISPTEMGVPQGGILSPLICNLVLDGLEPYIKSAIWKSGSTSQGCSYVRYADDMVVFTTTHFTASIALDAVIEFLSARGLQIKEAKTRITDVDNNYFEFLGYRFGRVYRNNKKRLIGQISVPTSAQQSFRSKISKIFMSRNSIQSMIDDANKIIRGWANYYKFTHTSCYTFRSLRHWTWKQYYKACYKLTKRRYDKASHEELNSIVMSTYFQPYEGSYNYSTWPIFYDKMGISHILADITSYEYSPPVYTTLARNAFITEDRVLLDAKNLQMKPRFRRVVLERWDCRCGLCRKLLDVNDVPYELHHILPKRFGGKDRPNNLVPLCTSPCHQRVSSSVQSLKYSSMKEFIKIGILDIPATELHEITQSRPE